MPEVALQLVLLAVVMQEPVGAVVLGIQAVPHLPAKRFHQPCGPPFVFLPVADRRLGTCSTTQ